ncbi:MAG: class I SAM-dependent methyltransferase [Acidobacteriota bacterium]|nr:class I SAM-dependent methyltransferase [Acidobacteriota bacterium]
MKARYHVERIFRTASEFFEDQWFDLSRNVRTSGNVSLQTAGVARDQHPDSEFYQPARPAHIRQALHEIPVQNVSDYSYIDLGSGKGRTLFIAAELPFRQITGVEFSRMLHDQTCENIRRFRHRKQGSSNIASLHRNAKDFVFPENRLVLYLFNPFGSETMQHVLNNLEASLKRNPRHVVILLLWPRCSDQVAAIEGMSLRRETRQYQIFEAHWDQPASALLEPIKCA